MPNPEVIEIEGWELTRHNDFYADGVRGDWTVSLDVFQDGAALDINCAYGATGCYIPLAVIKQLQTWHEESKARREAENG